MSSFEISFTEPLADRPHGWEGDAKSWDDGVYVGVTEGGSKVVVAKSRHDVLVVFSDGSWTTESAGMHTDAEPFTRVSDEDMFASIAFAGSMNYPDGKPEGGAM
ncbi:MAG: hypothetical protein ACX94C_07915 [Phycisphaerales bacterium]